MQLYHQAVETLVRLMEININTLGTNEGEQDKVWDSILAVRAVIAEGKERKQVGYIPIP